MKFLRARSRLYRRQILQVNTRWKALDEICKTNTLLHRSKQEITNFLVCFANFARALPESVIFDEILTEFQIPCFHFPFSYHSFQTDPRAGLILEPVSYHSFQKDPQAGITGIARENSDKCWKLVYSADNSLTFWGKLPKLNGKIYTN